VKEKILLKAWMIICAYRSVIIKSSLDCNQLRLSVF